MRTPSGPGEFCARERSSCGTEHTGLQQPETASWRACALLCGHSPGSQPGLRARASPDSPLLPPEPFSPRSGQQHHLGQLRATQSEASRLLSAPGRPCHVLFPFKWRLQPLCFNRAAAETPGAQPGSDMGISVGWATSSEALAAGSCCHTASAGNLVSGVT